MMICEHGIDAYDIDFKLVLMKKHQNYAIHIFASWDSWFAHKKHKENMARMVCNVTLYIRNLTVNPSKCEENATNHL